MHGLSRGLHQEFACKLTLAILRLLIFSLSLSLYTRGVAASAKFRIRIEYAADSYRATGHLGTGRKGRDLVTIKNRSDPGNRWTDNHYHFAIPWKSRFPEGTTRIDPIRVIRRSIIITISQYRENRAFPKQRVQHVSTREATRACVTEISKKFINSLPQSP